MTTNIDSILDSDPEIVNYGYEEENLTNIVMDLSMPLDRRIDAFEEYYHKEDVGDNAVEVLSTLAGMYQMSGSRLIEQFFSALCLNSNISLFLKLEAAKNLLDYEEFEEINNEEHNINVRERNKQRQDLGFTALNNVCSEIVNNVGDIPTPCRIEAICKLMESDRHAENANTYFCDFARDDNVECDFRYKSILNLEGFTANVMRDDFYDSFDDKHFVLHLYQTLKATISHLFPKEKKPDPNNKKIWKEVLCRLSYDDMHKLYKERYPDKVCGRDNFLRNAQIAFLFHEPNLTYYRILSGQYILMKCEISKGRRFMVESEILKFSQDTELDYNLRADAADVLLQLGSKTMQEYGRDIINHLGGLYGTVRSVFDNAQNVHVEEVEESVAETLEFLSTLPLLCIDKTPIDYNYVNQQVENMLKCQREALRIEGDGKCTCKHCGSRTNEVVSDEEHNFHSETCLQMYHRDEKIRFSMNRVLIDRALYSKFNSSLVNILLKIWTYLVDNDNEKEMRARLLEELEEMSGTCSTGYASRLVNVISGFGRFNIRISFEDQIIANFSGRLSARVRRISDDDSIFRKEKLYDVVELWLTKPDTIGIKEKITLILNPDKKLELNPTIEQIIDEYLKTDKEDKINECIDDFESSVHHELTLPSSSHASRRNFALFFRNSVAPIKEEMYEEFKDFVSDEIFDTSMRCAILRYEGEF